jgi:hypothetical protein
MTLESVAEKGTARSRANDQIIRDAVARKPTNAEMVKMIRIAQAAPPQFRASSGQLTSSLSSCSSMLRSRNGNGFWSGCDFSLVILAFKANIVIGC